MGIGKAEPTGVRKAESSAWAGRRVGVGGGPARGGQLGGRQEREPERLPRGALECSIREGKAACGSGGQEAGEGKGTETPRGRDAASSLLAGAQRPAGVRVGVHVHPLLQGCGEGRPGEGRGGASGCPELAVGCGRGPWKVLRRAELRHIHTGALWRSLCRVGGGQGRCLDTEEFCFEPWRRPAL